MWILTPLEPGGETHYLVTSKEYVVGRKNCDILLPNDQSISRAHAHLTATDQTLTLKDTSKYGSFVNSQRLTENTPVNLMSGDNVTFGVFHSKFSVGHQKSVVCSSCLDNDGKASLSQALLVLGGKLVNTWTQDCTHLAMPTAKVTIKTISALLCCRPIVKPEFFSELSRAVQQKLPPPKPERFIPEIDEPSLSKEDVNLGAIPVRKQLFTGKTFIFLSAKQFKRLSAAVSFGGGRSQLLEVGSLPRDLLESPQSCVIDFTTGSTQTLLPSCATEWSNSVNSIVQRKGLRIIIESEIGLAAIYASCDKYCNPSSLTTDSESKPKVAPRILSASLSQSVAVDETVLPAASQNITAYALNTEPSLGTELCEGTGVMAVGETPEKKQTLNDSQLRGTKAGAQKATTQSIVADTMRSSLNTVENTDSQRKKPESKWTVAAAGSSGVRPSLPRTDSGMKTFLQKHSPQKPKLPAQVSPQKQSTLTSFFQTVNQKRPLEDELFTVVSEPKRPALESTVSIQAPNTAATLKETSSRSDRVPAATSQTSLGSAADLFVGRSEADKVSRTVKEEPRCRKRKEMEEEIKMDELESLMSEDMDFKEEPRCRKRKEMEGEMKMDELESLMSEDMDFKEEPRCRKRKEMEGEMKMEELESLMSEDMDFFDEQPSRNQGQQAQLIMHSSTQLKQGLNTVEASSSSKRQRLHLEENAKNQRPQDGHEREKTQKSDRHVVPEKVLLPLENKKTKSSKPAKGSSAITGQDIQPFEEDEASFIEDLELLKVDICQPKEENKTPLKPVTIKQEVQESKINEDLPKQLVLVEFRSLTVASPRNKPQRLQSNSSTKNFKCFRKIRVPGAGDSPDIIGGSDLLVHNRGKNSDLDEWLKDVAEDQRRSRRDESVGDDLFRYNPTKLTRRR